MSMKDLIEVVVIKDVEEMEYHVKLESDRDKAKLVKRIEKHIRSSMEYRDYIAFLRDNVGMDACAFFNNINKDSSKSIRIEIHHEPLTLYDYTRVVLEKYIKEGLPINDMMISEEVMKLHYQNQVGLIPLSKTLHLIIHGDNSEKLVIPAYMIFGDYSSFIEEYGDYLDDDDVIYDKIEKMIERTKEIKKNSFEFLEKKYEYLKVDGFEIPQKVDSDGEMIEENKESEEVAC